MHVHAATHAYEAWMRRMTAVDARDLRAKHTAMREDPLTFFRGTYYRWAASFPVRCAALRTAPIVRAFGDAHVGSFGTWRDAEGRLAWGIDDFDEADRLPYTNDLVRLAASVDLAVDRGALTIKRKAGCAAILDGYRRTIMCGGAPIVLAESHDHIEKLGIAALKPPADFWSTLDRARTVSNVPRSAAIVLRQALPQGVGRYRVVRRTAGVGSRGRHRYVAIAVCDGGRLAREVKATVPSASQWLRGAGRDARSFYDATIAHAARARDPFQYTAGRWLVRRLAPDSNPIDILHLPARRDEELLLEAMGTEVANVHLGTPGASTAILRDLRRRPVDWLRSAAKDMARWTEKDWCAYVSTGP